MMAQDDLRVMASVAVPNDRAVAKRIFSITATIVDASLIVREIIKLPDFPDSQVERTNAVVELFADTFSLVAIDSR